LKKTISILLLLLFLYNVAGYYFVFKILQMDIRSDAKEQIEKSLKKDQLEEIVIFPGKTDKEIKWIRDGKEFSYKNKMYDIVKTEKKQDKIIFYCLNDEKEEMLFANLDNYVKRKRSEKRNINNVISKNITNYFFESLEKLNTSSKSEIIRLVFNITPNSLQKEVLSPPPKHS